MKKLAQIRSKITPKKELALLAAYVVVLVLVGFAVINVANKDYIKVVDKKSAETKFAIKPAKVEVEIFLDTAHTDSLEFDPRLENKDTILNLLEHLRTEEDITYERLFYVDRAEITEIMDLLPPSDDYKWKVYKILPDSDELIDVTQNIEKERLVHRAKYVIRMDLVE